MRNLVLFDFTHSPMPEIIQVCESEVSRLEDGSIFEFEATNPDICIGLYAGETVEVDDRHYIHRSLKAWNNLAELLGCRMLIPVANTKHTIHIRYQKLKSSDSFHQDDIDDPRERYGTSSIFARINKLEEPTFIWAYTKALEAVKIEKRKAVLDLGINNGDEFLGIMNNMSKEKFDDMQFTGIDYSASAIKSAKNTLAHPNIRLLCHDINDIGALGLGKYDLIISIGTLQSPNIETKPLVMSLVQEYLQSNGAMILGFPNARWIDGELNYGAKAPNYLYPEMSLVIKDIYWIKKYLQQHKFRVTITGKEYLFLTATKIGLKI